LEKFGPHRFNTVKFNSGFIIFSQNGSSLKELLHNTRYKYSTFKIFKLHSNSIFKETPESTIHDYAALCMLIRKLRQ